MNSPPRPVYRQPPSTPVALHTRQQTQAQRAVFSRSSATASSSSASSTASSSSSTGTPSDGAFFTNAPDPPFELAEHVHFVGRDGVFWEEFPADDNYTEAEADTILVDFERFHTEAKSIPVPASESLSILDDVPSQSNFEEDFWVAYRADVSTRSA